MEGCLRHIDCVLQERHNHNLINMLYEFYFYYVELKICILKGIFRGNQNQFIYLYMK